MLNPAVLMLLEQQSTQQMISNKNQHQLLFAFCFFNLFSLAFFKQNQLEVYCNWVKTEKCGSESSPRNCIQIQRTEQRTQRAFLYLTIHVVFLCFCVTTWTGARLNTNTKTKDVLYLNVTFMWPSWQYIMSVLF